MEYFWLCLSAAAAGAINAIAGGGTLLTFPALSSVLADLALANSTSTVALFPGSFASVWGYREQLRSCTRWLILLTPPSILGGAIGALLLEGRTFRIVVPWLILLAAVLFLLQPTLARRFKAQSAALRAPTPRMLVVIVIAQFLIGIYGGYFGAGIGILMLTSLAFLGLENIHQTNALKTFLAFCMNIVAAILFMVRDMVAWEYALPMALAAIAGGYLGALVALRLPPLLVRWIVIVIGFAMAAYYFVSAP